MSLLALTFTLNGDDAVTAPPGRDEAFSAPGKPLLVSLLMSFSALGEAALPSAVTTRAANGRTTPSSLRSQQSTTAERNSRKQRTPSDQRSKKRTSNAHVDKGRK